MRKGALVTCAALALALLATIVIITTASAQPDAVLPLALTTMASFAVLLLLGSRAFIGWTTLGVLGAVAIESGAGTEPAWTRALIIGCLWFVAVEAGWEAIDRRDGAEHTTSAQLSRVQDVAVVVGVALGVGLVAIAATAFAPVRSVALQALVLFTLVAALLMFARTLR